MKNVFLIISVVLILVTTWSLAGGKAGPGYKNLQVLPKNISEHELDSTMDAYKSALGVGCKYCHVRNNSTNKFEFDKDDKPEKLIARKMILMAQGINKQYFPDSSNIRAISCYTCHRGEPIPLVDTSARQGDHH